MNKKGDVFDIIMFAAVIFAVAIIFVISYKVVIDVNDNFQDMDNIDAEYKTKLQSFRDQYVARFDAAFVFVFAILAISIFVAVWSIRTHPVMFFVGIVLMVVIGLIAAILGNAFSDAAADATIASEVAEFKMIPNIMGNYLPVIIIVGMVTLIIAYAKMRTP